MRPANPKIARPLGLVASAAVVVVLGACSAPSQQASTATDVPPVPTVAASGARTPAPAPGVAVAAFGPGCADLPKSDDPGSLATMSLQPVATAVESNPELSTLHDAIVRAGLTDTLNTAPGLTVFAPTNAAFAALPAGRLQRLLADPAQLTALLEYHVSQTRQTGEQLLAARTSQQLAGGAVQIGGTAEDLTVTGGSGTEAKVLCGDITTQNANVLLVDAVLAPR
ncbi:fasciclin domain-containing protein [Pseudonocardia xishanensis]|uniref:Fasciclin domain-containing protein n=1 Tax=Pseudonocardia xishanensis TaxID=630995 RepID=A0ABP8S238_9PSEU